MIISFAWTAQALLAGAKTCTRRGWNHEYAHRFRKGMLIDAYDRSPRQKGKKIATIRLTDDLNYERLGDMPDSDYEAEGFAWFQQQPRVVNLDRWIPPTRADFDAMRRDEADVCKWVIRFELVEIV